MELTGLHILLTYQCTFECQHCFVWGSPRQKGVLNLSQIHEILQQARELDGLDWIYFEGGEPFLYYAILIRGVQMATAMGFQVGIVSNAYWATTVADALVWLKPFADLIADLTISSDIYHGSQTNSHLVQNSLLAAQQLGMPVNLITVSQPEEDNAQAVNGQIAGVRCAVMYRGRAASALVSRAALHPWDSFTICPHEDLRDPGRSHLDPLGNLHICQGISLGNVFQRTLKEICANYEAETHPVCGPLLSGGPSALVQEYDLAHMEGYADACHLCYCCRQTLRERFPTILTPDQMYGV